MGSPTAAERERRIERDDGDPEDVVYVHSNWRGHSYHESRECSGLNSASEEQLYQWPREQAQRQVKAPCTRCVLEESAEVDTGERMAHWRTQVERLREQES
jgi:hypothetical protein